MNHPNPPISSKQFHVALKLLFPTTQLKKAVALVGITRERIFPMWMVLWASIAWGFKPSWGLVDLIRSLPFWSRQKMPSESALYQSRKRLGWRPLLWLRRRVGWLANLRQDPDGFYRGRRLIGIDGLVLTIADTQENDKTFGRSRNQHKKSGFPLVRIVALCELGTHAFIHWIARAYRVAEKVLAARLLRYVPVGSLLIGDRNFHSYGFWKKAQQGKFDMLLRVSKTPKFPVLEAFPDGSYRSEVRGRRKLDPPISVRVIQYQIYHNGKQITGRLLTGMMDFLACPAKELVELYFRRWEEETAFGEFKGGLSERTTHLRATCPQTVLQELDGVMLGHYVVRHLMLQAARKAGIPANQISYTGTIRIIQAQLSKLPKTRKAYKKWHESLIDQIAKMDPVRKRRRSYPRVKKVVRCKWKVKTGEHQQTKPEPIQKSLVILTKIEGLT